MAGRRAGGWLVGVFLLAGLVWTAVAAGTPPTIERIDVDETFADEFLREACGIDVTTTVHGFVIERIFSGEGTGWRR